MGRKTDGSLNFEQKRAKFVPSVSEMCSKCQVPEDVQHYIFSCEAYQNERIILENTVEEILYREGLHVNAQALEV